MSAERAVLWTVALVTGVPMALFVLGTLVGRMLHRGLETPQVPCPDEVEPRDWDAAFIELLGGCQ